MLTVEFIDTEVPRKGVIGTVLHEREFKLLIDAAAFLPAVGEKIKLPGHRKQRVVVGIERDYLKTKTKIKVLLETPPKRQRGPRKGLGQGLGNVGVITLKDKAKNARKAARKR